MKILNLMGFVRWIMVWTATWTMLFSPVAMGQEANRVTKKQMQTVMDQLGLNRQITLGEFYKKNKHLYPERIQKEIEPLFMAFKNQLMPTFEVVSSKNTSGDEIATIRVTQGNELINVQWFGEKERMLKFQNTNLSEIDVVNFGDMYTRIIAGDEKYRKQIEKNEVQPKALSGGGGVKYPDVTRAEWKSMSHVDKANYIVNLRTLWQDARQVLKTKNTYKKPKKTSQNNSDKNKNLYSLIIGNDSEAAGKTVATGEKSANYFSGETCIVAGYVAKYEKTSSGEVCDHRVIDRVYNNKDNSLYKKANEACSAKVSGQIACNPYVFGTPNGAPTCVTPSLSNASFQKATHWDGPCDTASRLQSSASEIEILKDKKKIQGRYEDNNLLSEEERKAIFKKEQGENFKLTEDYLLGMLKFRGLVKEDVKSIFDSGVLSDQIYNQIILDKKSFDSEIAEAQKSCSAESVASKSSPRVHEKNYWPACDQLQRRFTFIRELFESKCEGKKLNPDTLKCGCDAPPAPVVAGPGPKPPADTAPVVAPVTPAPVPTPTPVVAAPTPPPQMSTPVPSPVAPRLPFPRQPEVVPGASCTVVLPPVVVAEPTPVTSIDTSRPAVSEDCESKYPGSGATGAKCICPNGTSPKKDITDVANGSEAWSCGPGKKDDKKDECGIVCKIFGGIKKYALPVLLTGAVVWAAYKGIQMLAPKKPSLNPPPDKCPDGSFPPCGQVCAAPLKKQANGSCSCDGCPPGQTANATTCVCATGTPTTTTTFLCPDSTTRVADLANCPVYACWNGQSYQNPLNCPPATPVVPASSGTRK